MKRLRLDNGDEYTSSELKKFCNDKNIVHYYTIAEATQFNRVAEMMNQTLPEKACCLHISADLPKNFWAKALSTTVFLVNRSFSTLIGFKRIKTPKEVWCCNYFVFLHIWLSYLCSHEGNLAPRAKKYIFLGYADGVKGYMLWCHNLKSSGIIINWDVIFYESAILHAKRQIEVVQEKDTSPLVEVEVEAPFQLEEEEASSKSQTKEKNWSHVSNHNNKAQENKKRTCEIRF